MVQRIQQSPAIAIMKSEDNFNGALSSAARLGGRLPGVDDIAFLPKDKILWLGTGILLVTSHDLKNDIITDQRTGLSLPLSSLRMRDELLRRSEAGENVGFTFTLNSIDAKGSISIERTEVVKLPEPGQAWQEKGGVQFHYSRFHSACAPLILDQSPAEVLVSEWLSGERTVAIKFDSRKEAETAIVRAGAADSVSAIYTQGEYLTHLLR